MSEWNSAETAPKDGTHIIYVHKNGYVSVCQWIERDESGPDAFWDEAITEEVEPVMWLPLPSNTPTNVTERAKYVRQS
jgi:hypothetical protein